MRIQRRFVPWLMGLFTAAVIAALGSPAGAELVANATAVVDDASAHAAKAGKSKKAKKHKAGKQQKTGSRGSRWG